MRRAALSLLFLAGLSPLAGRADDLVARDGTVYHDYKVLGHDAGYLTIMYSDGGGKILLSNLPDNLQKQYGYNKQQADAFVQASIAQDRKDRQAIAQEAEEHQRQMAAVAQAQAQAQAQAEVQPSPQSVAVISPGANPPPAPAAPIPSPIVAPGARVDSSGPGFGGAPLTEGTAGALTDQQRQAAITRLTTRRDELKAQVSQERQQKALQLAQQALRPQVPGAPVSTDLSTRYDKELADVRAQLHLLKSTTPLPPPPALTDDQLADVKHQIVLLTSDLREMKDQLDKQLYYDPTSFDYPDRIEDDNEKLRELKNELPGESVDPALANIPDLDIPDGPLTDQDIQRINDKIADLQSDITFMQKQEAKAADPMNRAQFENTPHGAFADKIVEEQKEIAALQARLPQIR